MAILIVVCVNIGEHCALSSMERSSLYTPIFGFPHSVAEELFLRSWKAYESQFGDANLMVVKPLRNLALFYSQTERYCYVYIILLCIIDAAREVSTYVHMHVHIFRNSRANTIVI